MNATSDITRRRLMLLGGVPGTMAGGGGDGLPTPPAGSDFIIDRDGAYVLDRAGDYIVTRAD